MQPAAVKGFRLSLQQARLWSLQQGSQVYRSQCAVLLEGTLDLQVFRQALQEVVNRHAILRTSFHVVPGMEVPVQVVAGRSEAVCPLVNLEDVSVPEQAAQLAERLSMAQTEPWDVERDQLLCAVILRLAAQAHVLLVGLPALCADAATLKHFIAELGQTYQACLQGEEVEMEPLQYADVSAWQDEVLQEEDAEALRAYWRKHDLSQLASVHLPFARAGRAGAASEAFRPQRHEVPVEAAWTIQVQALAQQVGVSVEALLLSCWQVLLGRLSGEASVLVGVACDGRHYEELATALGHYTRVVPLRTELVEDQPFERVLSQVNAGLTEAVEEQSYFTWEPCGAVGDSKQEPSFFPLSFEFEHWPSRMVAGDLNCTLLQCFSCVEPFALKLSALQVGQTMRLELHYDPVRLSAAQVRRLADSLHTLLYSVVSQPQAPVGSLSLLSANERQRLLQIFSQTKATLPPQPLQQLFEAQVQHIPGHLVVVCGSEQLSYQQLNSRANQVAHALRQRGVGPNVLVGLCVERSVDMLVGLLAILKAGGAYVPLDPQQPPARLAYQLADLPLLLTQERLQPRLPPWEGQMLCLDSRSAWWAQEPESNPEVLNRAQDLAYTIYTSGSTGVPKGVLIRQQSVSNYTHSMCRLIAQQPGLQFATVSTLAADLGNTAIFCSLASGGCLHVLDYETVTSGEAFADYVSQHPLDVLKIVPSHLSALLSSSRGRSILPRRHLVLGGEALSWSLLKRLRELEASCCVINHYGPTEMTIGALVNVLGVLGANEELAEEEMGTVPIGCPIANTEAYVLDRFRQVVPVGVTGELYLGGTGLATGYLHQPEQTAERFVTHPFRAEGEARLYKTGDLVRYTEGRQIEYVGRVDSQVKLRGYRIELGEIEAVLQRHPGVRESIVVLREEETGNGRLVAYVVAKQQPAPMSGELRHFVGEYLPEYMVPSAFVFLRMLPLTSNGKVDRRMLPVPEGGNDQERTTYLAPRSPIEEVLAGIWEDVLKVKQVSIHDNFSNLGGHSLLATQIISRLRNVLQVDVPLRSLFEAPTVAGLAEHVEGALRRRQGVEVLPLAPVSREQALPLSFAQQRLWFLDQFEPGSTAYNVARAVRLSGRLDAKVLEQSVQELVRRHESLRTTFQERQGQPVQVIGPAGRFRISVAELSALVAEQRETEARRLANEEAQRPFDLAHGPLLRTMLLRLRQDEHVLLLSMHHIISDGWSSGVFVHELSTLYNTFVAGKPSPLPELPIQYADFAAWQREWLQGAVLEAQVQYWAQRLSEIPPLELLTDYPRPAMQTFQGAYQGFLLAASLSRDLRRLSQRVGVTLFMTLLAAFQTLLARYTGQEDIAVGTLIANRNRAEIEGLIGFFINALVLRTNLSGNPSFQELLRRVREVCLGAYAHQDVPFEKLVEVLQPERDLSRSPLFQVLFQLQHTPESPQALQGLTTSILLSENTTAIHDITLTMTDTGQGLGGVLTYNTDLFDHATIVRLLEHWQIMLEAIVLDPSQRVAELPLLTPKERQQLLVDWNDTEIPFPLQQPLHHLFTEQAGRIPDAIALVYEETALTYGELNRRATRLAHHLRALGVGPEVLVGLYMQRCLEMVVSMLAILKAGGAYVPLDPAYPPDRLAFILADAQVQVLVTTPACCPAAISVAGTAALLCLEPSYWQRLDYYGPELPDETSSGEQLAYVIYTSGSTGRPKGVMVTQAGMLNHLFAKITDLQLSQSDRMAQTASHCFDIAVWQFFAVLLQGGQVHLLSDEVAHDPQRLLHQVQVHALSLLELVPSMLRMLLDELEGREPAAHTELDLRWLVVTGEAVSAELGRRWWQHYGQIPLVNAYGPTECADDVTHGRFEQLPASYGASVPIGRAIANMQLYLLDAHLSPVPIGVVGQVYIGGVGVGRGYLNDPGRTAAVFVPDPFGKWAGGRLYQTGDMGRYLVDGQIEYVGRVDQQVKVRGYRIELEEIEAVLEQHPEVRESVVGVWEEVAGDKRLVAYVVAGQHPGPSADDLRRYLRGKVPEYMLPLHFVVLEALPLTPNGKVDRRALPALGPGSVEPGEEIAAARTPMEELVAGLWGEVLGRKQVSRHENFFEVGGHSLLATQLISRIRAILHVEIPLRSLFEAPTVTGLAERVERELRGEQGTQAPPLVAVARGQELPLSFAQQRLWFLDQLEAGNPAYTMPLAVKLQGRLDIAALERSLQEIVRRHESLRTTFISQAGQPVQVISAALTMELLVVDLKPVAEHERLPEALRLADEEAQGSFDLSRGPLLRIRLLRLGEQEHVLLLTIHHIISDAWSLGVLVREFTTLYEAFTQGKSSPLPPLSLQYADFAVWQRQWLQGEVLRTHIDYWKQQLRGAVPVELPTDHPRPAVQSYRGASHTFTLPASLSQALLSLSHQAGVTLFMLLLAAFQTLLSRYTGQANIVVGTDIANRTRVETETLIGFFVNLLVLRTDLSGSPTFRELLGRVRERVLEAYVHQDTPFEMLVERLRLKRRLNWTPLVQVLFVLQNVPLSRTGLPGLTLSSFGSETTTAKFDVALFMREGPNGLSGAVTYSTDLFEASTIAGMMNRFEALLHSIVACPDASVDGLDFYTEVERARQVERLGASRRKLKNAKGEGVELAEG